jgi:hypothetical protein
MFAKYHLAYVYGRGVATCADQGDRDGLREDQVRRVGRLVLVMKEFLKQLDSTLVVFVVEILESVKEGCVHENAHRLFVLP